MSTTPNPQILQHHVHVGDTLRPLGATLKRDVAGVPTAVDLTGKTVKFAMFTTAGVAVVAETTAGVSVTDAEAGKVEYDFQSADVATVGTYYAYFIVEAASEQETFPPEQGRMQVVVHGD